MRTLSFSGLLFVCGTLTVGCNVWVDVEPIDPPGGTGGSGTGGTVGTGGSGTGGNPGTGGSGTGGSGTGGNPGTGGSGSGSTGGSGGSGTGGTGGVGPLATHIDMLGGDVEEAHEIFPFGVAVANNGTVFVSTLGNRNNEPSRIYRFNPAQNVAPTVLFEVGNSDDQAIYGLGFAQGKLYACSSQHLLSTNNNIVASIFEFDPGQLGQHNLGPNNVKNTQLRATAVNTNNNGFVVTNAQQAGRCGQFAVGSDGVLYIPDVSGQTDFIFRHNPAGTLNQPGGQIGDPVSSADLDELKMSAWYQDPQLVGVEFGTPGITFSGGVLQMFFENNGNQLFSLRPVGTSPEGTIENTTINQPLAQPFGLAPLADGRFLATDRTTNELLVLTNDVVAYNTYALFGSNQAPSFLQPTSVTIVGDKAAVVGSQIDQLGGVMFEDGQVFFIRY